MDQTVSLVLNTEHYQKLAWVLDLVKKGEVILNIICGRIKSAQ